MPAGGINTARDLINQFFGDRVKTRRLENDFTVGLTIVKLTIANPQRVELVISNFGANVVAISGNPAVTATTGILLAGGAVVEMDWFSDLDEVIDDWYAISAVAGNAVHVYERLMIGEVG